MPPERSETLGGFYSFNEKDLLLLPYVFLVAVYMHTVVLITLPPETAYTAAVKVAPILYLAGYVEQCSRPRNNLAKAARTGLLMSSLGDICLVWRHTLFLPGMFFFAMTQLAYIRGLRKWMRQSRYPYTDRYQRQLYIVLLVCYIFIFPGIDTWLMALCVLVYSFLLDVTTFLALQRHFLENNKGSLYGAVGACAFMASDLMIALGKWKFAIPFSEFLIMLSYYAAQGCVAAGAIHSSRVRQRELRSRGLLRA